MSRSGAHSKQSRRDVPYSADLIHANYADKDVFTVTGVSSHLDQIVSGSVNEMDWSQATTTKQPAVSTFTAQPCYAFDGVDDFMSCPSISFTGIPVITIALTVRTTGAANQMIWESSTAAGSNPGAFYVFQDTATTVQLAFKNTSGVPVKGSGVISAGVHRFIYVLDSVVGHTVFPTVYLDGVSLGAGTGTSDIVLQNFVHYAGMRAGTSLPWSGKQGDRFIFGRALTGAEILEVDAWMTPRSL